jgi:uncharacterized cupredoxin-like copper-binding protein
MNLPFPARVTVGAVASCAVLLAACGGSNDSSSSSNASTASSGASSGGSSIALKAQESSGLSFDKKSLTAKAGSVTLTMDNPSGNGQPHAIAVEGNGVDKDGQTVQPGGTSSVTVTLKPGTYEFYCPVDGHKQAGMKGTLTVS